MLSMAITVSWVKGFELYGYFVFSLEDRARRIADHNYLFVGFFAFHAISFMAVFQESV